MTTSAQDVQELRHRLELLDALEGADGIAAFLAAEGVRGVVECAEGCPIAVYLARFTLREVYVDERIVFVCLTEADMQREPRRAESEYAVVLDLPRTVTAFVTAFDRCAYPELIDA